MDEWSRLLKSERLRRGLSLQDIALKAERSISLLKALEQGRFTDIGSPALVRSHLWAYSRALDISPPPSTHERVPPAAPAEPTLLHPPQPRGDSAAAKKTGLLRLAAFCVIGFIAVAVFYQIERVYRPDREQVVTPPADSGVAPKSPVPSEPPASPSATTVAEGRDQMPSELAENREPPDGRETVPLPQQEATATPLTTTPSASSGEESVVSQPPASLHPRFEIEAVQASWVEVKVDGGKTEGFLLRPGEKREWPSVHEVQILVGNAGGVRMRWDGAAVNLDGRPGQVLRLRLPNPSLTAKSP